jgi:hypothetical protein
MRYSEIANLPSTPEEAKNAIMDIVVVYRGKDEKVIPMDEILSVLHNQGFDADTRWVMNTLKDQPGIERIEKDKVLLQTDEPTDEIGADQVDMSKEKVKSMAAKSAKKSISNG